MTSRDWKKYPNFARNEFACHETGEMEMQPEFMERLQRLRTAYGKPMVITSGYRSPRHSIEAAKAVPGAHAQGIACDIACTGSDAYDLIALAMGMGFTGIGISQHDGQPRYVHLDTKPRRAIWSY